LQQYGLPHRGAREAGPHLPVDLALDRVQHIAVHIGSLNARL
jgi:hypothetical protein